VAHAKRDAYWQVMFAVQPLAACPHLTEVNPGAVSERLRRYLHDGKAQCDRCDEAEENMLCMSCGGVFCGRHVRGHMLEHHASTEHPVVMGLIDRSFWCYVCDAYVSRDHPSFHFASHIVQSSETPPHQHTHTSFETVIRAHL
jgi:uncharacterized UBP type Zn finger protein